MSFRFFAYTFLVCLCIGFASCREECTVDCPPDNTDGPIVLDWDTLNFSPQAYELVVPPTLPDPADYIPADNPLTIEGVALGRKLFYDPILSADTSLSCAGCHAQEFSFTDSGNALSIGVQNMPGTRNSMALFNLMYSDRLFWDGSRATLESQALEPVPNPLEMHLEWEVAEERLRSDTAYVQAFYEALGTTSITANDVAKAIAQFERTIVSGNSTFDQAITPGSGVFLSEEAQLGYSLFFTENGDCFHCHGDPLNLFTDNLFHNNGLDAVDDVNDFADPGLGEITGDPSDYGKFRTPSLRNVAMTAPYMHDGRFETLEEVIDHYSEHIQNSPTLDPVIGSKFGEGLGLSDGDKQAIIAFLNSLTDETFLNNPDYAAPAD